jgi:hypothetical protein
LLQRTAETDGPNREALGSSFQCVDTVSHGSLGRATPVPLEMSRGIEDGGASATRPGYPLPVFPTDRLPHCPIAALASVSSIAPLPHYPTAPLTRVGPYA